MIQTIQTAAKPATKRKRLMLVQLPATTEQAQIVRYDHATMHNLHCKYVDAETGQDSLHFSMEFHSSTPLYFARSWRYIGFYYPIRQYADGSHSCRCLEWQEHRDCKDVVAVEDHIKEQAKRLPARRSSVA